MLTLLTNGCGCKLLFIFRSGLLNLSFKFFLSLLWWCRGIPHFGLNIDSLPVCSRDIPDTPEPFLMTFLQVHLTVFIVKIANSYLIATYTLKCFGNLFHSPYKSVITEIVRRRGEKSFAFFKIWSVIDLNLVHSHIADPGSENRSEARKYHVISLGAPNGHLSKPRIQMQSMVFSGVLTV